MADTGERTRIVFVPERIIETLNAAGVKYVVIGGIAAGLHGAVWTTQDLDVCHATDRTNVIALAAAIGAMHGRLRDLPADAPLPRLDARALLAGDWWTFMTDFGMFDAFGEPAPGIRYASLAPTAELFTIDDQEFRVASVEQLIVMKRAAGRPQDRAHLELLVALREETEAMHRSATLDVVSEEPPER